jgi:sialidase-1
LVVRIPLKNEQEIIMKVLEINSIYDNPIPQLRSRQSVFPFVCQTNSGRLLALHVIGEAFESADHTTHVSFSDDFGRTWSKPRPIIDKSGDKHYSDCAKPCLLPDGRILAIGYGFYRDDPELPIGNPETGGLLDDFIFLTESNDDGETWSRPVKIGSSFGPHVEASAPITVLKDGSLITPTTGFPSWDGSMSLEHQGRALRSFDLGKTWTDDAVCMKFDGPVTCYEQRMCQLESGAIINVGWNENAETGERLENHYTVSFDNGKTFSRPISTGIRGQASSVVALGGERLLALHAVRRDTDRPGIYGYVIDFSEKNWKITDSCLLWEPRTPVLRDTSMAEIFAFLKFGQPGGMLLSNGDVLMFHWYAEDGRYRTVATRISL